jgi:hypothetical protein
MVRIVRIARRQSRPRDTAPPDADGDPRPDAPTSPQGWRRRSAVRLHDARRDDAARDEEAMAPTLPAPPPEGAVEDEVTPAEDVPPTLRGV